MLFFYVYILSLCLLEIKTEETIIKIEIKQGNNKTCTVPSVVTLTNNTKYTLKIKSHYFILDATWKPKVPQLPVKNFSIPYERIILLSPETDKNVLPQQNNATYTFSYTSKADQNFGGNWTIDVRLLVNYDPQELRKVKPKKHETWKCNTTVVLVPEATITNSEISQDFGQSYYGRWGIIIFATLFVIQSIYIIVSKIRGRASKKKLNDEGSKTNTANRPQLPLPAEEEIKEERLAADQRIYSTPAEQLGPFSKQSYGNEGFDISDELVKSPGFSRKQMEGPYSKQSNRNQGFDMSDELVKSPGFSRKQIDGPYSKQSNRNQGFDMSDELVKSPGFSRKQIDGPYSKQSNRNQGFDMSDELVKSPGFSRKQIDGPYSKQSNRNKGFDMSEELVKSPGFSRKQIDGPTPNQTNKRNGFDIANELVKCPGLARKQKEGHLLSKQPSRLQILDDSEEETMSPPLPRRHMEEPSAPWEVNIHNYSNESGDEHPSPSFAKRQIKAKLGPVVPPKVVPSKPFKSPKPTPHSPPTPPPPVKVPVFHPALRQETTPRSPPTPPPLPEKAPTFHPAIRQEPPTLIKRIAILASQPQGYRMSDDDWQYEALQPSVRYLNR